MRGLQLCTCIVRISGFPRVNCGVAHLDVLIVERYVVGVGIACCVEIGCGCSRQFQLGVVALSVVRHFKVKRGGHFLRENDDLRSGGTAQLHGNRRFGGCGYGSRAGSRVECAFVLQPLQRVAGRFRFVETETIACLEGELDETHAVVERMVAGEAHRRVVGVACGSRGKEEVDVRALLVGCGADGHRSALSLIRIVGMEGMRFGVIEIDGRTVGHELTVLSLVGHVGEACAGDADAVAVGPVGSFRIDAGSGRNVGDKLGGYRAVIQVLIVVVTNINNVPII